MREWLIVGGGREGKDKDRGAELDMDRDRRHNIWRGWALMGRDGDGTVRLGDLSKG